MEENYKNFREMKKSAFIVGYTGETGKALVNDLVKSSIFEKIILLGRREVKYPDDENYKCLDQKIIDFENLSAHQDAFSGCDVGYCCLGTTRGKSGKDGFYKVDHDYIMNTAKLAKEVGCKDFHLVSSSGASANSSLLYPKVKGQVENELTQLDFDRLVIYRPKILMSDREESRPGEKLLKVLVKPIQWMSPTAVTTPTTTLAKAMVNCTVTPTEKKTLLLENGPIFEMVKENKVKCKDKDDKGQASASASG